VLWDGERLHALAARWVQQSRRVGALGVLPVALDALALAHLHEGDLAGAASIIDEAEDISATTGGEVLLHAATYLAALRGRDDDAATLIEAHLKASTASADGVGQVCAQWAGAALGHGLGRFDEALAAAQKAASGPANAWGSQASLAELVEAAARTGRATVAADALDRLSEAAEASGGEWALGVLARSRAQVSGGRQADELYRQAIERLGRTVARVDLARAHLLYGEWLAGEERRADARAQLRTAHDMFATMGVAGFTERAERELRAAGESVRKRNAELSGELTAQEREIGLLAAAGRSNPEIGAELFISARTVEWHLRKVFTKLNVSSRRELPGVLPTVERSALSA
jgi:ATP/maltotriose-dependent transcriptional regulator MalT